MSEREELFSKSVVEYISDFRAKTTPEFIRMAAQNGIIYEAEVARLNTLHWQDALNEIRDTIRSENNHEKATLFNTINTQLADPYLPGLVDIYEEYSDVFFANSAEETLEFRTALLNSLESEDIIVADDQSHPELLEELRTYTQTLNDYYGTNYDAPVLWIGELERYNAISTGKYIPKADAVMISTEMLESDAQKFVIAHELMEKFNFHDATERRSGFNRMAEERMGIVHGWSSSAAATRSPEILSLLEKQRANECKEDYGAALVSGEWGAEFITDILHLVSDDDLRYELERESLSDHPALVNRGDMLFALKAAIEEGVLDTSKLTPESIVFDGSCNILAIEKSAIKSTPVTESGAETSVELPN